MGNVFYRNMIDTIHILRHHYSEQIFHLRVIKVQFEKVFTCGGQHTLNTYYHQFCALLNHCCLDISQCKLIEYEYEMSKNLGLLIP